MTSEADFEATRRAANPKLIKAMIEIATNPAETTTNRLKATNVLLSVAMGPRTRPPDHIDAQGIEDARAALSDVAPFLEAVMKSKAPKRNRVLALKLSKGISGLDQ